ncbi:hypothetical protein M501DRAFT_765468 [Patellaria atrata CBS 101060]|uniref:Uncharacterized protein n=1 Tax=Patellaria atrata CBS 101060 TaxID=1346257 RepID=A0A9P4VRA6_9PEZI|nr:hypothetical protein M501DRAFT_765468 [Patellaria atrata CBS 101060]
MASCYFDPPPTPPSKQCCPPAGYEQTSRDFFLYSGDLWPCGGKPPPHGSGQNQPVQRSNLRGGIMLLSRSSTPFVHSMNRSGGELFCLFFFFFFTWVFRGLFFVPKITQT